MHSLREGDAQGLVCLGSVQPLSDVVKDSGSFGFSALLSVVQGLSYPQLREKAIGGT